MVIKLISTDNLEKVYEIVICEETIYQVKARSAKEAHEKAIEGDIPENAIDYNWDVPKHKVKLIGYVKKKI